MNSNLENVSELLTALHQQPESHWAIRGEQMAIKLFHEMAARVPAYQDFLQSHNVKVGSVKSSADLKKVPTLDKDNYIRKYPLPMRSWDGAYPSGQWTVSSTSGSTGVPTYFPRSRKQDEQYALTAELYLRTNFEIQNRRTLYVVGFPMGAWIGGLFTYEALEIVRQRGGYDMTIITPGINKAEIIQAIKLLGSDFDQIIIGSYAPFLKDIIDDGIRAGIDWKSHKLGFIFSAEGFSEVFRDYIAKKTGLSSILLDTLNHYGTVDLGTMSHETPLAIMLRRLAVSHPMVYQEMFGQLTKLPTLTQYIPEMFYFEEEEGSLICSADNGMPLVRYDLKDRGAIVGLGDMRERLQRQGVDMDIELKKAGLQSTSWNLPFVYVYERGDFSVSFYAFQIYPETVRKSLHAAELEDEVTGKFTMEVVYAANGQQRFEVNIELKSGVAEDAGLTHRLVNAIRRQLIAESSEYRETYRVYNTIVDPKVICWPYEHTTHFAPGIKQKWVKK